MHAPAICAGAHGTGLIASTLKLVNGSAASEVALSGADATLDRARNLSGDSSMRPDLDIGAMAAFGPARLGLTVKNVSEPSFGSGDAGIKLQRKARAGFMFGNRPRKGAANVLVAFDVGCSGCVGARLIASALCACSTCVMRRMRYGRLFERAGWATDVRWPTASQLAICRSD